jgi:hypothetical protein
MSIWVNKFIILAHTIAKRRTKQKSFLYNMYIDFNIWFVCLYDLRNINLLLFKNEMSIWVNKFTILARTIVKRRTKQKSFFYNMYINFNIWFVCLYDLRNINFLLSKNEMSIWVNKFTILVRTIVKRRTKQKSFFYNMYIDFNI